MSKCDLAGFNLIRFDIPLLQKEFERSDIPFSLRGRRVVDAYKIYITREPRNLTAAVNYYCDREHRDSHSALHDARACWNVLQAQLERYEDLSSDLDDLHDFCNPIDPRYVDSGRKFEWRHKRAVFAFGKHQGKSLHFVAKETADYLEWMLQSDFPSDTLAIVGKALKGVFPKQT
jgi:DNA polymerase-3 subunit epsilon